MTPCSPCDGVCDKAFLVFELMAYFHCRTRIHLLIRIRIPNPVATLYYAEHVHITDSDSDSNPDSDPKLLLYSFLKWISVFGIRVRVRQCK